MRFLSLTFALIIAFVPINSNAQSEDITKEEIYSIIDNLDLQNIKLVSDDIEGLDSVEPITFDNVEELEEYLIQLDKDATEFKENMVVEVTKYHLRDGEWVEISEEEYRDIVENLNNLEVNSITPYADFADYFSQSSTIYDYKGALTKGQLRSTISYGIERTPPRAKFVRSDDIYPSVEHFGYFTDVRQSPRVTGANANRIVVEYSFKFYSKLIVPGGNEVITLIDSIKSAYTID